MSDIFLETPAPQSQPEKPNPFIQIIKGFGYFLIFLAANTIVTFGLIVYYAVKSVMAAQAQGLPYNPTTVTEEAQRQIYQNTNSLLILYTILFIIMLVIIFAIRKKNFFEETRLRSFSPKLLPALFVIALGLTLFINSALNLLPRGWLENYSESSSFISSGTLIGSLIAQALCAPITEELTFRGLMLSRFNKALPKWLGIAISSIFFGLVHGELIWFVYAACLGAFFCFIAEKTNSIIPTILLHAAFNTFGTVLSYIPLGVTLPVYA
ncbi:MAG: CPBP family intramembrane metalloprotease, partial [Lachnospiraceae bacterium]|nr:CPBP family intramembrane metalloprotease [Lachnospiraceae bacterium]